MTFDLKGNAFLSASKNTDDSFTLSVDRSKLKPESQTVLIKVALEDSFGN